MASRRAPLANVPNAANSPFRNVAATNGKRTRAQAGDNTQGQPPAKKHVIELVDGNEENRDPHRRGGVTISAQEKLEEPFARRSNQPTAFEKKLAAVREKKSTTQHSQSKERVQRSHGGDNLESIRQWQKHYRRQFPSFVLYFDNVPDDVRLKTVRQIQSLGAREEKFFSNKVTHVVTTRQVPPDKDATSPDENGKYESAPQKISAAATPANDQRKTTDLLNATLQRRSQSVANIVHDNDSRKTQTHGADILTRARQLGIKIWALEKLQRMLKTILETDVGAEAVSTGTRIYTSTRTNIKAAQDADLAQLLRNEKVNGPADRDMTVAAQDMCTFSGNYIYIHDMDEKTKPVMVRDYPKVSSKEDGKWPQFRLSGPGRCPFVEDPSHAKRIQQQQAAKAQEELVSAQRKTRAASAQQSVATRTVPPTRALTERQVNLRRSPRKQDIAADSLCKPLDPPKGPPAPRQSSNEGMPAVFGSAQQSLRGLPRMIGGEPVASGVQPSNVTSAIRSQYISSAAISSTAPGANYRVGDSKEVSALKRKVLERAPSVTSQSLHSMPSSHMNDIRAAINHADEPPPRAAKRKAQETLGVVPEDEETGLSRPAKQRKPVVTKKSKPVEKDPKPGYCENCRDKFEDFDEHIQSRKHRKFAHTQENWKELDALLVQLKRPHKHGN